MDDQEPGTATYQVAYHHAYTLLKHEASRSPDGKADAEAVIAEVAGRMNPWADRGIVREAAEDALAGRPPRK